MGLLSAVPPTSSPQVLAQAKRLAPKGLLSKVAVQFQQLIDQLEKLCNAAAIVDERNRIKPFSVRRDFAQLKRMMPVEVGYARLIITHPIRRPTVRRTP